VKVGREQTCTWSVGLLCAARKPGRIGTGFPYALPTNRSLWQSIEAIKQHLTKQVTVAAHQQQQQEKKRPVLDVDKATLLLILLLREGSPSSQDVIAHISHDILNAWSQQDKVDLTARWATFEKDTFQELVYSFKRTISSCCFISCISNYLQ